MELPTLPRTRLATPTIAQVARTATSNRRPDGSANVLVDGGEIYEAHQEHNVVPCSTDHNVDCRVQFRQGGGHSAGHGSGRYRGRSLHLCLSTCNNGTHPPSIDKRSGA